jgi:hypothetical protein
MTALGNDNAYTLGVLGKTVTRATANLPQTATGAIFTVAGGRVAVTAIVGIVTTNVQAQANAVKIVATPTTGTVNDLSTTVDINGLAAGGMLSPTGLAGDALVKSTGGGVSGQRNPIIVAPGAIGLSAAASNTGQVRWVLTYVPLEAGATVVAA